jgi:hypothetical protein
MGPEAVSRLQTPRADNLREQYSFERLWSGIEDSVINKMVAF